MLDPIMGKITSEANASAKPINMSNPYGDVRSMNSDLFPDEEATPSIEDKVKGLSDSEADYLATKVQNDFSIYKAQRLIQEQIWVRAHQNYKGVYPADMDFCNGSSRAFVQVSRPKVQTMVGMVIPILLPNGTNAWTLEPSATPYDPDFAISLLQEGVPPDVVKQAVSKRASKAADEMTTKIKDGLQLTDFPAKLARTVLDGGLYGTSVVMGPLAVKTGCEMNPALSFLGQVEEYRPELEVISPFDFYPPMGARCIEECPDVIVRKILGRPQLRDLRNAIGFKADAIDEVLRDNPDGNWTSEYWESIVNITNSQQNNVSPSGRFVVLVRWGWLSGRDLQRSGLTVTEDLLEEQVMTQVWVVGNRVISLRVSELHQDRVPFYVTPFNVVPHSIWGEGICEMMFDSQDAINATERAKMDNMSLSCRPMFSVNVDRLAPGENILELRGGKFFKIKESELNNEDPIKQIKFDCHMADLQNTQNSSMQLAEEQTTMPKLLMGMGGEGVHNRTAGGASMQFNAAITPLKAVLFNFENNLISPMISAMARFYTEFSKDESIKGNHKVVARGVQGLMAREALLTTINTTLQVIGATPEGAAKIDYDQVNDLLIRYNDLVDVRIMKTDTQVTKERQQKQQEEMQMQDQQAMSMVKADKLKAESSPKDALLAMYGGATEGSETKAILLKKLAEAYQFMDQELAEAMDYDSNMAHMSNQNLAHEHGASQAQREADISLTHAKADSLLAKGKEEGKKKAPSKPSLAQSAEAVRSAGASSHPKDTVLAHVTPGEAQHLKAIGGSGVKDPRTGLTHFDPPGGEHGDSSGGGDHHDYGDHADHSNDNTRSDVRPSQASFGRDPVDTYNGQPGWNGTGTSQDNDLTPAERSFESDKDLDTRVREMKATSNREIRNPWEVALASLKGLVGLDTSPSAIGGGLVAGPFGSAIGAGWNKADIGYVNRTFADTQNRPNQSMERMGGGNNPIQAEGQLAALRTAPPDWNGTNWVMLPPETQHSIWAAHYSGNQNV